MRDGIEAARFLFGQGTLEKICSKRDKEVDSKFSLTTPRSSMIKVNQLLGFDSKCDKEIASKVIVTKPRMSTIIQLANS
ncbi:hypothetical protein CEXT_616791 [Caerostris extrusa]|uniref:Uncharacterized protein n=1 Tax=Caerostris extrusa TaxID=172846 RepID=A0AAV4MMW9_CAEEX|nr:hypothetical protein CEXT_616791 [Caerostris extrusa]